MSAHFINLDRAQKFEATIGQDKRNPELPVLVIRGFDTVSLTLTRDQLKQIGDAIQAEMGGSPF